jgi:hypothetical protein
MGALYSLETASAVKRYIAETDAAVRAGRLMPGSTLSLRDTADELGVRWSSLSERFGSLERDGLLAIDRCGMATVAPLDELEGLLWAIRPNLTAAAAERVKRGRCPAPRSAVVVMDEVRRSSDCVEASRKAFLECARPGTAQVAFGQLQLLTRASGRYYRIAASTANDQSALSRGVGPDRVRCRWHASVLVED